jgi:hypothetical protein
MGCALAQEHCGWFRAPSRYAVGVLVFHDKPTGGGMTCSSARALVERTCARLDLPNDLQGFAGTLVIDRGKGDQMLI